MAKPGQSGQTYAAMLDSPPHTPAPDAGTGAVMDACCGCGAVGCNDVWEQFVVWLAPTDHIDYLNTWNPSDPANKPDCPARPTAPSPDGYDDGLAAGVIAILNGLDFDAPPTGWGGSPSTACPRRNSVRYDLFQDPDTGIWSFEWVPYGPTLDFAFPIAWPELETHVYPGPFSGVSIGYRAGPIGFQVCHSPTLNDGDAIIVPFALGTRTRVAAYSTACGCEHKYVQVNLDYRFLAPNLGTGDANHRVIMPIGGYNSPGPDELRGEGLWYYTPNHHLCKVTLAGTGGANDEYWLTLETAPNVSGVDAVHKWTGRANAGWLIYDPYFPGSDQFNTHDSWELYNSSGSSLYAAPQTGFGFAPLSDIGPWRATGGSSPLPHLVWGADCTTVRL